MDFGIILTFAPQFSVFSEIYRIGRVEAYANSFIGIALKSHYSMALCHEISNNILNASLFFLLY